MDAEAIQDRIRACMEHQGQTCTISGRSYKCYPTGMRDTELRNRAQTFRENYQTSIAIVNADVTVAMGDKATFGGSVLRVLEVSKSADGLQNILHLGNEFGGV